MNPLRLVAYGWLAAWAVIVAMALWIDHEGRHPYGY